MADVTNSGPSLPDSLVEVRGRFASDAALQDAIGRLTLLGFDRSALSVPAAAPDAAHATPEAGAGAPNTEADERQLRTFGSGDGGRRGCGGDRRCRGAGGGGSCGGWGGLGRGGLCGDWWRRCDRPCGPRGGGIAGRSRAGGAHCGARAACGGGGRDARGGCAQHRNDQPRGVNRVAGLMLIRPATPWC